VVWDGSHIWVVIIGANTVPKMTTAGVVLGTYTVGANPLTAVFDGAFLWVSNDSGNAVSKLAVSTGQVVNTDAVGKSPFDLAFDDATIGVG
jgi:DNA-binding beta-propeller fold protein YncE